uniref:PDZ and LIM domain protein Zasp n=1 Tax=Timema monikensis TaxID=170555 RepID=A0A7R9E1W7_9NEOP|nr:unnamed protein product [Timema monikensis]
MLSSTADDGEIEVNGGSLAEKFGLQPGDALIRVNNVDLFDLKHKDAQDSIVRAGNNYELTIQRGGNTWRPSVTTVGPTPKVGAPAGAVQPVTKTSLAARKPDSTPIGGGHNLTARPFGPAQVNGDPTVKSIVNKQYNSPVGIYSEQTIAETLSAQAEVLAGGVLGAEKQDVMLKSALTTEDNWTMDSGASAHMTNRRDYFSKFEETVDNMSVVLGNSQGLRGVNFKKNEKNYNAENSEVFKMVHEIDNEPRDSAPEPAAIPATIGLGNIPTPEIDVPPKQQDPFKILPPGQNICSECERLIIGVFVRIKDKNLHAECFKCATCGSSLKNVGYYKINEKLYCDIHAKQAARQNPPAPNLEPVIVPPGRSPASSISAALSGFSPSHTYSPVPTNVPSQGNLSPQTGTLAPLPFHEFWSRDTRRQEPSRFVGSFYARGISRPSKKIVVGEDKS